MRTAGPIAMCLVVWAALPSPAFAQRFGFERTFEITGPARLEVSTNRGKIDVVAGEPGRVIVEGVATVRVGWNVPVNAIEIAKQVAATPPVEQRGPLVRLHDPTDPTEQQAVIVSYRVRVPPETVVQTTSDSGATSISGVAGAVEVRTHSAAIAVDRLAGATRITTGSGAVTANDIAGALDVTTSSSAFRGRRLGSALRVTTQSGAVDASLAGKGDVDVETGSSPIDVRGVRGGLVARTQSGRITADGVPLGEWSVTTGSSAVNLDLESTGFLVDASSRSGSVTVTGIAVSGQASKHAASGTVGKGGPTVRVRTGSGAIRIHGSSR